MKFYEIEQKLDEILSKYAYFDAETLVNPETGEIVEEEEAQRVFSELEDLQMEKEQKLENIACWIKGMDAEEAAIKVEEKNLATRRKTLENKRNRIFEFLQRMLDGAKINSPRVKVNYRKTTSVNVIDLAEIPKNFKRVKVTEEADKAAIKEAFKAGEPVPGAELVEGVSMSIK